MKHQIKAQRTGGHFLAQIKPQLVAATKPGINLAQLDELAEKLLLQTGGQPSFKMVPGYHWSTCINLNDSIVHGIPRSSLVIKSGDLVTLDIGLYYKGFHTDTSVSFIVGKAPAATHEFLNVGKQTLSLAIDQAIPGNTVWDISHTIQTQIEAAGYSAVRDLTGHGVGKQLHQEPAIPCYTSGSRDSSPRLQAGQAIAIEVMYTQGDWHLIKSPDNWTLGTRDRSLSAVLEETVIVNQPPEAVTLVS